MQYNDPHYNHPPPPPPPPYQQRRRSNSGSSEELPPDYIKNLDAPLYKIMMEKFGKGVQKVQNLVKLHQIPANFPLFNSQSAQKLYYAQIGRNQFSSIIVSIVFGLIGIILIGIGADNNIKSGDPDDSLALYIIGGFLLLLGIIVALDIVKIVNGPNKDLIKPYIFNKMDLEQKSILEDQANIDADQYYRQTLQYVANNSNCIYINNVISQLNLKKYYQNQVQFDAQTMLQQQSNTSGSQQVTIVQPPIQNNLQQPISYPQQQKGTIQETVIL